MCLLIVLLLSLMNSSLCREHSNIPLVPYYSSLFASLHSWENAQCLQSLSYTCDSDQVITIVFITIHYHKAEVIGATKYERAFKLARTNYSSFTVEVWRVVHRNNSWCHHDTEMKITLTSVNVYKESGAEM